MHNTGVQYDEIYDMVYVVLFLKKKYGSLVKTKSFMNFLGEKYNILFLFLRILLLTGKLNKKDLGNILQIIGAKTNKHNVVVSITSGKEKGSAQRKQKIESYLASLFEDCAVQYSSLDTGCLGLYVRGSGWYYKRTLVGDLQNILSL